MMDVTFSTVPGEWCDEDSLELPEESDEGESGVWTPSRIIDVSNLGGSTITVTFTPTNPAFNQVSFDIEIQSPPYLGVDQTEPLMFCKTGGDIFVDLVDTLDLQLSNIMTLQGDGQLFSFISENSFNPSEFETELRNINLKDIPVGPYTFFVESAVINSCLFQTKSFSLEILDVTAGDDAELNICFGNQRFHNFDDLIDANPNGAWQERIGSNSGLNLSSPSSMDLSITPVGQYLFDLITQGSGPCSGFRDTATLTLNIQDNSELALLEPTLTLCGKNNISELTVSLTGLAPFDFSIQLADDNGNLFPPLTINTNDNAHTFQVQHTTGITRIEGNTIFLNQSSSFYDVLPVALQDENSDKCFNEQLTGSTRINFDFLELDINETICEGDNFFFLGEIFNYSNPSGSVLKEGTCDTLYHINLSFMPPPVISINEEICENESIVIKGQSFSANNLSAQIRTSTGISCDTIFDISISLRDKTVSNVVYELCPGQFVDIGNNTYDTNNPSGSEVFTASNGCDSIVTVNIIEKEALYGQISNMNCEGVLEMILCESDTVEVSGEFFHFGRQTGSVMLTSEEGCDSIINVNLVYSSSVSTDYTETLCEGDVRTFGGQNFDFDNPSGTVSLTGSNGCDSIINVDLTFGVSSTTHIQEGICDGSSYDFGNGIVLDAGNPTFTVLLSTPQGCDSTINYEVIINATSSEDISNVICEGESITVGNEVFDINNPTGTVSLTTSAGCDSIINVNLTVNQTSVSLIQESFCGLETITVGNTLFDESNPNGTVTLTNSVGCDSIITVDLSFGRTIEVEEIGEVCGDESFDFGNGIVLNSGNLTETRNFTTNIGCDSIVNYSLVINQPVVVDVHREICENGFVTIEGETFNGFKNSGTIVLTGSNGCDSTLNITVSEAPQAIAYVDTALCIGQSIVIAGITYTSNYSGGLLIPNGSKLGCDSFVEVSVRFSQYIPGPDVSEVICIGEELVIGGETFDENNLSGQVILTNAAGCDTLVQVALTVEPELSSTISDVICKGSTMVINGQTYDSNNLIGQHILTAASGCDSTVYVNLTLLPDITSTIDQTICKGSSVMINGVEYSENNLTGESLLSTLDGCDSTVYVNLTLLPDITSAIAQTICKGSSVMINGVEYSESNLSGESVLSTLDGCDSTVFVNVSLLPDITSLVEETICRGSSVMINGVEYSESNLTGESILSTSEGCDSIVYVNISVYQDISSQRNEVICAGDFMDIEGQRFDANNLSGVLVLQNSEGCDSTVFVNIDIAQTYLISKDTSVCASEFGLGINSVDVLRDTLFMQSVQGCDSIFVLNMYLLESSSSVYEETLCADEFVNIGGERFDINNPTGSATLTSAIGCDSIVNVDLTYITSTEVSINSILCEGEEMIVNGTAYNINNTSGQEIIQLPSGCDSVILIDLTFKNQSSILLDQVLCENESIEVNGVIYDINTPRGQQILAASNGCDSIIDIDLNFSIPEPTSISQHLCAGEELVVAGNRYDINNPSGNITLQNALGCDSVIAVDLIFTDIDVDARGLSVCPDDPSGGRIMIEGVFDGMAPFTYSVNGLTGDVHEFPSEISNLGPGNYDLEIYDAEGCSVTRRVSITQAGRVDIAIDWFKVDEGVYELELRHTGIIDSFRWESLAELSCENCFSPTVSLDETSIIRALVYDEDGCLRETEIRLEYVRKIQSEVANIFNTSSTTGNDKLYLTLEDDENIEYDLLIFNRWGEIIYKARGLTPNDPSSGWDGTRAGRKLDNGVYIYEMMVKENNVLLEVLHGDVTLID